MRRLAIEVISLQSGRGRLIFFLLASILIFFLPLGFIAELSLWQRLGIPAPSIGLTRAYRHLLHGDVYAAWQQNKFIFIVIAVGIPLLVRDFIKWLNEESKTAT